MVNILDLSINHDMGKNENCFEFKCCATLLLQTKYSLMGKNEKGERNDKMKKLEFDENVKEKLKECIGQELKYGQLCSKIGLETKRGNAKISQLNDLASYCDMVKLSKPTRYLIKEVYEFAFKVVTELTGNDKFQAAFDGVLFQALLNNNGYPLYASGLELVELFQEVNKNFAVTFSEEDMKTIGYNYAYMAKMSEVVYSILYQWTRRKIESMNKRGVIRLFSGYRVYTEHKTKEGKIFLRKYDVPTSTSEQINELDVLCDKIYLTTRMEILPPKKIVNKETGEIKLSTYYPNYKLIEFDRIINERIYEATDGQYCKMKRVNVILPPYEEWMIKKLKEIYKEIPDLQAINEEACRKILETTQLDNYTNEERKRFVLFNMTKKPPFMFRDKLKEIEEENEE